MKKTVWTLLSIFFLTSNIASALTINNTDPKSHLSLKVANKLKDQGNFLYEFGWDRQLYEVAMYGLMIQQRGNILALVDPPAGTFYSGEFTFHYDSSLLALADTGWLGDWGTDSNLSAPPTDPNLWGGSRRRGNYGRSSGG